MNASHCFKSALISAALFPGIANGSLLVAGWYDFDGNTATETADVESFGFSGQVIKPPSFASSSLGGSTDGLYGNSSFVASTGNDGFARTSTSVPLVFSLTNVSNTSSGFYLTSLLFDAARSGGGGSVSVSYQIDSGSIVPLGTTGSLPNAVNTNYGDYAFNLIGVSLGLGQTIKFFLSSSDGPRIDNVAIVAIPEPASLLALGGVIASGLMLRNRRPSARPNGVETLS